MARIAGRSVAETRARILRAAAELVSEGPSREVRVLDVAERAHVGTPTIYYHFSSREVLLAEAQVENFFRLLGDRSGHIEVLTDAIERRDREAFVAGYRQYLTEISAPETTERMWQLTRVLLDISADPVARARFVVAHDASLQQRIDIFSRAQERGWVDASINATAYVLESGALILGRIMFDGTTHQVSPEDLADYLWSRSAPPKPGAP